MPLLDRDDDRDRDKVEKDTERSIRNDELDAMLTMEEKFRVIAFNHLVDKMSRDQAAELLKDMHKHLIAKNRVLVELMKIGAIVENAKLTDVRLSRNIFCQPI